MIGRGWKIRSLISNVINQGIRFTLLTLLNLRPPTLSSLYSSMLRTSPEYNQPNPLESRSIPSLKGNDVFPLKYCKHWQISIWTAIISAQNSAVVGFRRVSRDDWDPGFGFNGDVKCGLDIIRLSHNVERVWNGWSSACLGMIGSGLPALPKGKGTLCLPKKDSGSGSRLCIYGLSIHVRVHT